MKGILGKKVGMTQIFDEQGEVIPVTVIEAGPCFVSQVKTVERDGYAAVQMGFEETKSKHLTRPQLQHLQKTNLPALRFLRELRLDTEEVASLGFEEGQKVTADIFETGEYVDVTGTSKGKGFAGTIKRHHFRRGPETHGSDSHRAPGSIGGGTYPGKVFRGSPMAGHMGHERVTVKNATIVRTDSERNLLLVKGPVPGPRNALVVVRKA